MKRSALNLRLLLTFFGGFALLLSTAAGLAGYSTSPAQPSSVALQDSSIPEEPPPLPASFYGAVALEGEPVLPGTSVSAWIDGVQFAASATFLDGNVPVYRLDVPADHLDTPEVEGGRPGDTIVFQVSGFTADQTAEWQSASNSRLDLSATPSPEPTAHFTIGKGLNTAQWEDGASVVNFSSVASTSSSVRPENAIDNSSSTIWRTATGQTTEQWVKVALIGDGLHVVDRVILRGSSSSVSLKDFDIRVSTTGAEDDDFTTIFSGSVPRDNDLHEFTFSPVHARYVQLFIRSNHGGSQLQVNHFQVWTREREGGIVSLHEGPPAAIAAFSSQLSVSFSPENAIDEIPGSAWLSANGQTAEQWFIVELGGGLAYTIDRVRLQSGSVTEGARDFEIRVSTTGIEDADFTTVFSGTAAANTDLQEFVFSAPAPARYVQLFVRNNHGSTIRIRVNAFQVLTPDGANVSRLEGVGAFVLGFSSQSSASTRPENAIDFDDSNTAWRTASGQVTDQWLTIRLIEGAPYLIDRIRLKGASGTSSPKDFEIRVSNTTLDDTSFTTVLNGTLPSDGQFHWFTLPPVEARYVQLFISDNYGGSQIAVIDFRVFSPELGGATVPFDDFSTDFHGRVVAWQWDFGDGKAATEQHPIHTFATPGVYTVRLTVTDNEGFTGTTARAYHVLPGPVADFTWSPLTPDEGQNTNFVDTSTSLGGPIVGRLWQFSHTSVGSTSATPAIRFPDNGEFTATLSATDSQLLTATVSRTITVLNVPPTVNAGNDQVLVWGQDWQINTLAGDVGSVDRGSLRCLWDYGDGQTLEIQSCNSTSAGAPHAYADPGVYTATLTVSDKDGASSIDSLVATVHKRDAILLNYSVRSISNSEAEVKAGLFDTFDWDELMTGQTITFDATGQVVTATVDANGVATALLSVLPGQTITLTTSFAGDTFYNAASDIDVVTVAPTLPSADIVFIIDESGSMADDQNQVKARVNDIVDQLGHSTDFRLGLVGFATTFGADRPDHIGLIHTPLTADVDLFKAKLNGLVSVLGRAYGFNATTVAMSDQMDFRSGAGVCAILITDSGGQEANPTSEAPETREEAVAALQSRNAVFLGIVNVNDVNIRNNYGPNGGSLAAESGGDVFHILDFRANPGLVFAGMIDHCVQQIIERTPPDLSLEKSDGQAEVAGGATL
ncbi:MAG TPA: discoidin domain-containing protein, partial [Anaerolineae bacterium]